MTQSDHPRNQLDQVICQIRYPAQLSIDRNMDLFQDRIRGDYPGYAQEQIVPIGVANPPGAGHIFTSPDSRWSINVSTGAMSLTKIQSVDPHSPARRAGVRPGEILVVHDEVDLPAGEVKLKLGGGLNAHNGLRSIADKLGSRDFARVQFGIGRPPGRMQVADYVLRELKGTFLEDFELTVERAADLVEQTL